MMSFAASIPDAPEVSCRLEIEERYSRFITLLDRILRQRQACTGFIALLRDEVIAYQLVWPD